MCRSMGNIVDFLQFKNSSYLTEKQLSAMVKKKSQLTNVDLKSDDI